MSLVNFSHLKKYRDLGYNVLLEGEAGVGKTAIIKQAFEGLNWLYFSASTLDPWVDLIGVPRAAPDPTGGEVLELVRPAFIKNNDVEAIFFDELNRAPEKVLNAVMELIQFKSINGYKLKNLKVVWAAINPSDAEGTYSVTELDPAQRDRFQVQIAVPFEVDADYFSKKYPESGWAFVDWWTSIPKTIRRQVSPRRLDYAAGAHAEGCRLEDFLPRDSNIPRLKKLLKCSSFIEQLADISTKMDAKVFLADINNAERLIALVKDSNAKASEFFDKYGSLIPEELADGLGVSKSKPAAPKFSDISQAIDAAIGNSMTQAIHNLNAISLPTLYKDLQNPAFPIPHLEIDFRAMILQDSTALKKFTTQFLPSLLSSPKRLQVALHGTSQVSNVSLMLQSLASADKDHKFLTLDVRKRINDIIYRHKIYSAMHWLPL